MTAHDEFANRVSVARGDHFALLRDDLHKHADEHGCEMRIPEPWQARQLAVFARAIRATYVLHIGARAGYTSLHVASGFGHTGQLDAVEADGTHAKLLDRAAKRHALGDRIRVMEGRAQDVVPPLNGPYDLILVEDQLDDLDRMYDDLVRLVRVGGSIAASLPAGMVAELPDGHPGREWLERVALDERIEVSATGDADFIMAVRVR